jgi:hypothetical protein
LANNATGESYGAEVSGGTTLFDHVAIESNGTFGSISGGLKVLGNAHVTVRGGTVRAGNANPASIGILMQGLPGQGQLTLEQSATVRSGFGAQNGTGIGLVSGDLVITRSTIQAFGTERVYALDARGSSQYSLSASQSAFTAGPAALESAGVFFTTENGSKTFTNCEITGGESTRSWGVYGLPGMGGPVSFNISASRISAGPSALGAINPEIIGITANTGSYTGNVIRALDSSLNAIGVKIDNATLTNNIIISGNATSSRAAVTSSFTTPSLIDNVLITDVASPASGDCVAANNNALNGRMLGNLLAGCQDLFAGISQSYQFVCADGHLGQVATCLTGLFPGGSPPGWGGNAAAAGATAVFGASYSLASFPSWIIQAPFDAGTAGWNPGEPGTDPLLAGITP